MRNESLSSNRNGDQPTPLALATSPRSIVFTQTLPVQRIQTMRILGSPSELATATEIPSKIFITSSTNSVDTNRNTEVLSPASTSLRSKLMGDVAVATAVTFGVSPFLTVVDKAIVESANGSKTLLASARDSVATMVRHPIQYFKSPTFLLMWAVYGATYSTANSFKTLEEHQSFLSKESASKQSSNATPQLGKLGTFLGTTFVNSGASILKDRAYARMFSAAASNANALSATPKSFPKTTYAMWMMRDFSVIGSSFILPDMVSKLLVEDYGIEASKAQSLCQLSIPVVAQFVAGPFHFLGLDFYNRQYPLSTPMTFVQKASDRARALYECIGPVVAARIARIAPGYGIGGVWNTKLRNAWRESLVQQQQQQQQNPWHLQKSTEAGMPTRDIIPRIVSLFHGDKVGRSIA
jgi:hypothetical protein